MPANYEDENTSVVVGVIRDLTKRVDDYEERSSHDRASFKESIEAGMIALRRDFHKALAPLQLDNIDHRKVHENDRLERIDRQKTTDDNFKDVRKLIYLVIGLLVGFIITGIIIIAMRGA